MGTERVLVFAIDFLPLRQGGKVGVSVLISFLRPFSVGQSADALLISFLPLRQGAKKVFRRSSKSASVPFEGRTLQYDVRTTTKWGGVDY